MPKGGKQPGAGRPIGTILKPDRIQRTIYATQETWEGLQQLRQDKQSVSDVIESLVKKGVRK